MEQFAWIIWLVLGIVLIIAETFTFGFVLFWFGIGAIAAALAGLLGAGVVVQFGVFAVVSVLLTVMSRTIFQKYLGHNDEEAVKTGIDALPGQIGTVSEASRGALREGAVKVYGSIWTAFPVDGAGDLVEGEKVEVVMIKGSSIYVRPLAAKLNAAPNWRDEN